MVFEFVYLFCLWIFQRFSAGGLGLGEYYCILTCWVASSMLGSFILLDKFDMFYTLD